MEISQEVKILKELEIVGAYLEEILKEDSSTLISLLKALGYQEELKDIDHSDFCNNKEEYIKKAIKYLLETGYVLDSEVNEEKIQDIVSTVYKYDKGTLLACRIRDNYISDLDESIICPICKEKPDVDIKGKNYEHVVIRCNCGYIKLDERGL